MAFLVNSCWFFLASSLILLINFISRRVSRIGIGDSGEGDNGEAMKTIFMQSTAQPSVNTHSDVRNLDSRLEDELPGFIFKFEHQISDHGFISKEGYFVPSEEESESNSSVRIHNYRFSSEKDFNSFVVEPEVEAFLVQELYVLTEKSGSDDEGKSRADIGSNFASDKYQKQQKIEDENNNGTVNINDEPENTDDNSRDIEMPEVKNQLKSDFHADDDASCKIGENNGIAQAPDVGNPDGLKMINDMPLNQDACLSDSELSKQEYPIVTNTTPLCEMLEENGTHLLPEEISVSNVDSEFLDDIDDYSVMDLGVEFDDKEDADRKLSTSILSSEDYKQTTVEASQHDEIDIINKKPETREEQFAHTKQLEQGSRLNFYTTSLDEFRRNDGVSFMSEEFSGFDSDSESLSESDGYSVKDLIVDSDGFLSERDFDGCEEESTTLEDDSASNSKFEVELLEFLHNSPAEISDICHDFNVAEINLDEHLAENDLYSHGLWHKEIPNGDAETSKFQIFGRAETSSNTMHREFTDYDEHCSVKLVSGFGTSVDAVMDIDDLPEQDVAEKHNFDYVSPKSKHTLGTSMNPLPSATNGLEQENDTFLRRDMDAQSPESNHDCTRQESVEVLDNSEETRLKDLNEENFDELESLWEHQDLIEQLRMELRKVKAIGLPTILEESETPKTIEDLKPWKIEKKLLHEDPMDELHKFYKSYREKMRKLDILNYQKMYAVGFLQQKDPLQSMVSQKPIIPTLASIVSQNLWPIRGKSGNNESNKFIKELRCELELVYVGQSCLSWEFLCWQYEKVRELPDSDLYKNNQYNQVAGDFQQFQVILQRFIENETFHGPRLPNYVKNRCVLRNLLQVPAIMADRLKDKMEDQKKGNFVVTSEVLEDIMEETIRIFWEFVKADKDKAPGILKAVRAMHAELQDSSDAGLMLDIQADLQKKKQQLKSILRTGNCLVKKFKKPKEDRSNQDLFFSQVDLKIVARVLRMSRITTDQLVWCHKKLNKIMIVDRKVYREPSFLLFPC